MTAFLLPDVSLTDHPPAPLALDWVGMQGIDLPLCLAGPGLGTPAAARADVAVDLPAPDVKGIHMSRLYRLVLGLAERGPVTPSALRDALAAMIASHADCGSTRARLRLAFDLLVWRPALTTPDVGGWKRYPVMLAGTLGPAGMTLRLEVDVVYASTCPCSAALSRQLVEAGFREAFQGEAAVAPDEVAAWLRRHATLATPHSQRSVARVGTAVDPAAQAWQAMPLIARIEAALGTPVQTAVKRADEQAFARLNGENLMFVEDAARRIRMALADGFDGVRVRVLHAESLHPHDAVAEAG